MAQTVASGTDDPLTRRPHPGPARMAPCCGRLPRRPGVPAAPGLALAVLIGLAGCGSAPDSTSVAAGGAGTAPAAGTAAPARTGTPELRVGVVAGGLSHVWDVGFLPDGQVLVTERAGRLSLLSGTQPGAHVRRSGPTSTTCTRAARAG